MIYALLVLFVALSISGVAAFYSIVGLTTIFSGSVLAVAIMGSVLEIGKLISASWLYRNWNKVGFLMRSYLTVAVVVLMFITSMGIFGYLSKAHIQQTGVSGGTELQVELIDHKIGREQKQIDDAEGVVIQLDKAVQILMDFDRVRGPTGAIAIRQGQKEERAELSAVIDEASNNIGALQEKKIILEREQIELEVEVGPVKYIAELIYGEEKAKDMLDEAVRAVILILILVFDPLAVLLLIAASISLEQVSKNKTLKNGYEDQMKALKKLDKALDDMPVAKPERPIPDSESRWMAASSLLPEDITNTNPVTGSVNRELLEEMFQEPEPPAKLKQIPDLHEQVLLHNDIYGEMDEVDNVIATVDLSPEGVAKLPKRKPTIVSTYEKPEQEQETPKPDWIQKVVAKPVDKETLASAIDNAYEKAKKSANIAFNLDGPNGDALKKILIDALTNKIN